MLLRIQVLRNSKNLYIKYSKSSLRHFQGNQQKQIKLKI